jgi:HK97 gp10 family phage protein
MASISKQFDIAYQTARINKQLNAVVDECSGPIEQTLLTQASLVASEQRSLAPVDETSPTPGALKQSVRVEKGQPTAKKALVIKIKAGGPQTLKEGKTGKPYDYGRAVEFGTKDVKPRSFFFPIWRARKKDVRAAVRAAVKKAVKDTFK